MGSAGTGTFGPRDARPRAMAHPKSPNPTPAAALSKVSQESPGMDHPGPAELALMSPVTPSENLQRPVSSLQVQPAVSNKPDPPTTALPSPVPSPTSHPSPIQSPHPTIHSNVSSAAVVAPSASDETTEAGAETAQLQRDETASPGQQAPNQPSPPSRQDQIPRPNPSRAAETSDNPWPIAPCTANPSPRPLQTTTNGTRAQSLETTRALNQSPSMASKNPLRDQVIGSRSQRATPTLAPTRRHLGPTLNFWIQWKLRANQLFDEATACSSPVAAPRALLLSNACTCELDDENRTKTGDLFYLVLHQIFCELSRDPHSLFTRLPVLREKNCQYGLARLAELLEDNSKLPTPLLEAFCIFPARLEEWAHAPWYKVILEEVVLCLSHLVTLLKPEVHRKVYERRYPPLAKELRRQYGVKSPVLQGVIFNSICRHVYEPQKLDLLQCLFKKDLLLMQKNVPDDAFVALIKEYRGIPMIPRTPVAPPRNQRATQLQGVASVGHPHPTVQSSVINSPAISSPALSANGQLHPTYPSPHIQSPNMLNVPRNIQQAQYVDHCGRQIPAPQAWQITQMANVQMAQDQAQPAHPVLLQPVDPAQGQGQSAPVGPVYMVAADKTLPVLVPVSTIPSQLNPSLSPSQFSVPGWPNNVTLQQQPQSPQQLQHEQQQLRYEQQQRQLQYQQQQSQSLSVDNSSVRLPSACQGTQSSVITRTNHLRARQPPSIQSVPASVAQVLQTPTTRPPAPAAMPLLPPVGHTASQIVQPNPVRLGLHQADLRDPVKQLVRLTPGGGVEETALYQYLGGFSLSPTRIDPDVFSYRWKFPISADDYKRFPRYQHHENGQRSIRTFLPGCRTYRLRVIALPDSHKERVENFWPTANTTWPSVLYIFVNNKEMYVRRKLHNGKDLPLDITRHLREGENEVNVHFLLGPGECKTFHYALGVEVMEISEYNTVLAITRKAPASETRVRIKQRLKPTTDDDELAVVTDSLTIPLIDPFMARIFNTPARSSHCNHIECFDLETFITTRKSESGHTAMIDNWLCPICKADARPQFLTVDNFFVDVREELRRTGCLETALSIQVEADGKWTAKTTRDNTSPSDPTRSRLSQTPSAGKRKADSMTDGAEQSARTKVESAPRAVQEPTVIEID